MQDTFGIGDAVTINYPNGETRIGTIGQATYRQGRTVWAHVTLPEGSEYVSAIVPVSYLTRRPFAVAEIMALLDSSPWDVR